MKTAFLNKLQNNIAFEDMKHTIHIIDDEHSGRTTLKILIEQEFWQNIETLSFSTTFEEAKANLTKNKYDIVLMDINLNGLSGFDLLEYVSDTSKVVFVTAYSQHMLEALRKKAFDYLVKPVKEAELRECLSRLKKELNTETANESLHIKHAGLTRSIKYVDIIYIKANGPYCNIYVPEENYTVARTLKSVLEEVRSGFVRVHKTFAVNRNYIKGFNKDKIVLTNNLCLPVSKTGLKNLS